MKNIKPDAMPILAEVCMEENGSDVVQSFKDIKLIDDLLGILKVKNLLNHSKGRKSNREKRFNEILEQRGHKVRSEVTNTTDYLCIGTAVSGRPPGPAKLRQARDLGVKVVTLNELLAVLIAA